MFFNSFLKRVPEAAWWGILFSVAGTLFGFAIAALILYHVVTPPQWWVATRQADLIGDVLVVHYETNAFPLTAMLDLKVGEEVHGGKIFAASRDEHDIKMKCLDASVEEALGFSLKTNNYIHEAIVFRDGGRVGFHKFDDK